MSYLVCIYDSVHAAFCAEETGHFSTRIEPAQSMAKVQSDKEQQTRLNVNDDRPNLSGPIY